uniref:Uncharacterized protein n=1 Tax=Arundo donax TaxID=35708 RepID=A0A0A9ENZ8_ARUDO
MVIINKGAETRTKVVI